MSRHCAQYLVTAVALLLPFLLLLVRLSVLATTPSAAGATIPVLTATPTEISTPLAINDEGLVVGYSEHALLWKIELAAPQD